MAQTLIYSVIRAGGRAIVRLPVVTLLGAWLKAVNTKLFKVNYKHTDEEANQLHHKCQVSEIEQ